MGGHNDDHDHADHGDGPKVLSVSPRNPRVRTIQVQRPTEQEASFLRATLKGLAITVKHFGTNFFRGKGKNLIETVEYPEEKVTYPERFRGLHRLMLRPDESVRCVACMCCPTVCPAHCITIIPAETDDKGVEKAPAIFEIDELRCVVCGLCVEACPCDAIRMDTGVHAKPVEQRGDAIMTRDKMMKLNKELDTIKDGGYSKATQGGEGADWRERR
jgi:NADH-quinone oxidoreductase subunit I